MFELYRQICTENWNSKWAVVIDVQIFFVMKFLMHNKCLEIPSWEGGSQATKWWNKFLSINFSIFDSHRSFNVKTIFHALPTKFWIYRENVASNH